MRGQLFFLKKIPGLTQQTIIGGGVGWETGHMGRRVPVP